MFDSVQVLEDFVSVGNLYHAARIHDFVKFYGYRPENDAIMRRRRPEGLKESVVSVLHQRKEWTTRTLAEAIDVPWNQATATSLAMIMHELGWNAKVRTRRKVVHFTKCAVNAK